MIKKAMILSAGIGTRMLPISGTCPKPLIPILNIPNIYFQLALLHRIGIKNVIINLHHLGDKIEKNLGKGNRFGINIEYSKEDKLLGTGGGLKKVEPFFKNENFILMNSDFISNVSMKSAIQFHQKRNALATMILLQNSRLLSQYPRVGTTELDYLCSLPKLSTLPLKRSGMFTGIHILHSDVFPYLTKEPSGVNDVLYPRLMKEHPKRIFGYYTENSFWFDTGSISYMLNSTLRLFEHPFFFEPFLERLGYHRYSKGIWSLTPLQKSLRTIPPVIIGENTSFASNVSIGPRVVIGNQCRIHQNVTVKNSIILDESEVKNNLSDAVHYRGELIYENRTGLY